MDLTFGPGVKPRLHVEPDDVQRLRATTTAAYRLSVFMEAHGHFSTADALRTVQQDAHTAVSFVHEDDGMHWPLDRVLGAAFATLFAAASMDDIEQVGDAAERWTEMLGGAREATSDEAIRMAQDQNREPSEEDLWEMDSPERE